jgi:hypothetical protein
MVAMLDVLLVACSFIAMLPFVLLLWRQKGVASAH